MDSNALYERDFYAWIQYHIELLKQGKLEQAVKNEITNYFCYTRIYALALKSRIHMGCLVRKK